LFDIAEYDVTYPTFLEEQILRESLTLPSNTDEIKQNMPQLTVLYKPKSADQATSKLKMDKDW